MITAWAPIGMGLYVGFGIFLFVREIIRMPRRTTLRNLGVAVFVFGLAWPVIIRKRKMSWPEAFFGASCVVGFVAYIWILNR